MKLKFIIAIGLLSAIAAVINMNWQEIGREIFQIDSADLEDPAQKKSYPVSTHQRSSNFVIFAAGRVEGIAPEVNLFATIRERITNILVQEGEAVAKGQVLIELDAQMVRAELELAIAGVQIAQAERDRLRSGATQNEKDEAQQMCEHRYAEMITAGKMHERGIRLAQSNTISQADLDAYESRAKSTKALYAAAQAHFASINDPARIEDIQSIEARLAAAKAKVSVAEAALAKTRIVAPSDGQVLQINVEIGELPSEEPMLIMCDTTSLQVRASVDEFDALRVRIGQTVKIKSNALPNTTFEGRVSKIRPRMHHKEVVSERPNAHMDTRSREIWVELEPGLPLIVGLPVELWIDEPVESDLPIAATL
ncbi:MAG: HlyD family efflux transporter periplasmic adaptor subunit [Pirellulaceae bacterium]|nr:HlyD family efflux transporter periplasmic adaptor subunit [Pirellulaceae bacterium]